MENHHNFTTINVPIQQSKVPYICIYMLHVLRCMAIGQLYYIVNSVSLVWYIGTGLVPVYATHTAQSIRVWTLQSWNIPHNYNEGN